MKVSQTFYHPPAQSCFQGCSLVIFESLLTGKPRVQPTIVLRESPLVGKGVVYEVTDPDTGSAGAISGCAGNCKHELWRVVTSCHRQRLAALCDRIGKLHAAVHRQHFQRLSRDLECVMSVGALWIGISFFHCKWPGHYLHGTRDRAGQ